MSQNLARTIGVRTAAGIVVANMIGAGIFTTTGFQAADLGNPVTIYLLWILGGVLALAGALCYAELGAAIPRAGGEYAYLHATYGGMLAFASALVSLTAGFSAPIASALKGLSHYLRHFYPVLGSEEPVLGALVAGDVFAICAVWGLVAVHIGSTGFGLGVTNIVTALKVLGILLLVGGALTLGSGDVDSMFQASQLSEPKTGLDLFGASATSLIFVMFCYSGWNAASYLAGEMRDPGRDLPRALLAGTATVMVAYLALNFVYFYGASVDELAGKVEVGLVASRRRGPGGFAAGLRVGDDGGGPACVLRPRAGLWPAGVLGPRQPHHGDSGRGADPAGDRDFGPHRHRPRRPDPAVRGLHPQPHGNPGGLLRHRSARTRTRPAAPVSGLGLSLYPAPLHRRLALDDGVGLPRASHRVAAGPVHRRPGMRALPARIPLLPEAESRCRRLSAGGAGTALMRLR